MKPDDPTPDDAWSPIWTEWMRLKPWIIQPVARWWGYQSSESERAMLAAEACPARDAPVASLRWDQLRQANRLRLVKAWCRARGVRSLYRRGRT